MRPLTVPLLSLAALAVGCGDRAEYLDEELSVTTAPVALDGQLVFLNEGADQALVVDVSEEEPASEVTRVPLPVEPTYMERRLGEHDEVLVLADGRRATQELEAADATLTVLDGSGGTKIYGLTSSPFDQIRQSSDGHYAALFRQEGSDHLLENTNLVAIVDLDRKPSDDAAVHFYTLEAQPRGIVYSPPIQVGGQERELAVVLMDSQVTIIDLGRLDRRVTTAGLSNEPGRRVAPAQVVFGSDAGRIFVRPDLGNDIFSLKLTPREADDDRNDFATAIDILGIGTSPTDMALYDTDAGPYLLALAGGGMLATVVDVATSRTTAVRLPTRVTEIETFELTSGDEVSRHALLWQAGGTQLLMLDLDQVEERRERNLEQLQPLGNGVSSTLRLPGETRLLFVHATAGLSLLDLQARTVAPFASQVAFDEAIFDVEGGRIWVAPRDQEWVSFIDLDGGATHELLLDANVSQVVPVFTQNRLAIVHPSDIGHVSLVDSIEPERSTLRTLEGFFLHGLVD